MKFINWFNYLIEKIGVDKLMHFFVGTTFAFIVLSLPVIVSFVSGASMKSFAGYYVTSIIVSGVLTFIAAVTKEIIDEVGDRKDILATMLGWFSTSLLYSIIIVLCAI